jgi:hypothetical protein
MGSNGMVEMVALVFVLCVVLLLILFYVGDVMKKTFLILIGVVAIVIGFLALVFGLAALTVWILMLLWNSCLVGTITGVSAIGFWKAWGLLFLSGLLFKGGVTNASISQFGKIREGMAARKAAKKYVNRFNV